jgi:ATP-dependent Clp protease adaptor protein ClpS
VGARERGDASEASSARPPAALTGLMVMLTPATIRRGMATRDPRRKTEHREGVEILERPTTRAPRRYVVVFHNDDYTTMEFVVHVLVKFFHKSETEATHIMLSVHHKGWGIVGFFTRDVAETKAAEVMDYAKQNGHPLRVTAEPEGFGQEKGE